LILGVHATSDGVHIFDDGDDDDEDDEVVVADDTFSAVDHLSKKKTMNFGMRE
jgi:hypothetical protein